jgi:hypothetical protein
VGAPFVETEQNSSVRIEELTKLVVRRCRLRLAEERLVPLEARADVVHPDDRPSALHGSPPATCSENRWTIPNLHHSPTPPGLVFFRTFFGLGFLDVHVEMTADGAQNVTARIAGFGTVYFDELSAFTTSGTRLLTDGAATAMVDNGATLARPFRLNDFAFKIVRSS